MNTLHNSLWSAPWWNDADTTSMFDQSLLDGTQTPDGIGDGADACFYLPPSIDSSDSDYSFGPCRSPEDLRQDGDDLGEWLPFSPEPSAGVLGTKLKQDEDKDEASVCDYSSPTWPDQSRRDSSGLTDGDSCPSPASPSSRVARNTVVKRLRSSSAMKKARVKERKDSTGNPERMNRHNLVEKKYRNRLNQQFELLIATLTEIGQNEADRDRDRTLSKSSVLQLARQTMLNLDRKNRLLSREVERLTNERKFSRGILVGRGPGQAPFLL